MFALSARRPRRATIATLVAAVLVGVGLGPAVGLASAVQYPQSTIVNQDPVNWTPHVIDGKIMSLAQIGDTIFAGGLFTQVQEAGNSKPVLTRSNFFAYNAVTGAILDLAPSFNAQVDVVLPAADGQSIYVGGRFTTVGGVASQRLARLSISTGAPVAGFTVPSINSHVLDMRLRGNQLILGGAFSYVSGSKRIGLASLNATTGALTKYAVFDIATTRTGIPTVMKMDVTPDLSTLVMIGNFTSIGTETRPQIAKLTLTDAAASLADWRTDFYTSTCASVFDSYMRDMDISPDGSYFVVSTTGAYRGAESACDVEARFETAATGSGIVPTWRAYTGGDTTYAVAITEAAVYVGGHMRWMNNPYAGDKAGPGAVPRPGIAALDPRNGLPYAWNPTRARGVGVFDMLANDKGLWIGSDTDLVYNEVHRKIAFFPISGGTSRPTEKLGSLPNDVYLVGRTDGVSANTVRREFFDGSSAPSNEATLSGGESFGSARGAMLIDDKVYTAWSDGTFRVRTFDGSTFGASASVNLYNGYFGSQDAANVTGMFFDKADGRMYFTLNGSTSLFWRAFTPESEIVGAARFTATGDISAFAPGRVQGMFLSDGRLYFADKNDGHLYSTGFSRGVVTGPVALVDSSIDWRARGAFVWNGKPAPKPNTDPVAEFSSDCSGWACSFDASASLDPDADGQVASFDWQFGDEANATGKKVAHTFTADGDYTVKLTVTDDRGGTGSVEHVISVQRAANQDPIAAASANCDGFECTFDGGGSTDPDADGGIASYEWDFGDGASDSGKHVTHTYASAGSFDAVLTVVDDRGGSDSTTVQVQVQAPATSKIAFRDKATYSGNVTSAPIKVPGSVREGDALLMFVTTNTGAAPSGGLSGWTLVGEKSYSDMRTRLYAKVAQSGDAGSSLTVTLPTVSKTDLTLLAYDGTDAADPIAAWSGATEASTTASHASPSAPVAAGTAWVVSYWADKSSSTTAWALTAGQAQRSTQAGVGGGHISSVSSDTDSSAAKGTWPGVTATANAASARATMWTVVLKSE